MKYIGIPGTTKNKGETIRAAVGGILLLALIVVCVLGAETLFSASQMMSSSPMADSSTAASTSAEYAAVNIEDTAPELAARSADASIPTATPAPATPTPVPTPAISETPESAHYYVTGELYVRSGPGTEYEKVGSYNFGDEVDTSASTSNGWKKLTDGTYVVADYLSSKPAEKQVTGTYYAIGEVNVRSGPGTEYSTVKTLKAGDPISVVAETSNGWYRTAKDTYVKASVCTSTPPATPAPTPTPKPTPTPTPAPGSLTKIGSFKITFYGPTGQLTHSGAECTEGRTIAVDPDVIPLGTKIYIENDPLGGDGYYIAEDIGSAVQGNIIDIFVSNGEDPSWSTTSRTVYIVNK